MYRIGQGKVMSNYFFLLIIGLVVFASCDKGESANKKSIQDFLQDNNITDYSTTDSGLIYIIKEQGEGGFISSNDDTLRVHYVGYDTDNQIFGTSVGGTPFKFILGKTELIKGFEEGVKLLQYGGQGTFYMPNDLAYGVSGASNGFGANLDLIFDIKLLNKIISLDEYITNNNIIGAKKLDSGLIYIIAEAGEGSLPKTGQKITTIYSSFTMDGEKISANDTKTPFTFVLGVGNVIPGWDEGLAFFKNGSKGTLLIPSHLAYGTKGAGPIEPNADLRFEMSITNITD